MIITTTNTIEGREIDRYIDLVFGEVVTGMDFIRDLGASFRDFFGGRVSGYEEEIISARQEAISELRERAIGIGADAVIGCKMDYEVLGQGNGIMMVTISGTAVTLK